MPIISEKSFVGSASPRETIKLRYKLNLVATRSSNTCNDFAKKIETKNSLLKKKLLEIQKDNLNLKDNVKSS